MEKELEYFKTIFESVPIGIFQSLKSGKIIESNNEFAKIFGFNSVNDLISSVNDLGTELYAFPDERKLIFKKIDSKKESSVFEIKFKKKNGEIFDGKLTIRPYFNVEINEPVCIGAIENITEKNKLKEKLKIGKKRYRSLVKNSNDAILILKDDKVLEWNKKAYELFEIPKLKSSLFFLYDIFPEFQPDGRKSVSEAKNIIERTLNGESQIFEWVCKNFNNEEFYTEVSVSKIDIGVDGCFQAIIRDITERKKSEAQIKLSEEKFRLLFENMPNGFILYDILFDQNNQPSDIKIILANNKACQFYNLSNNELVNHSFKELGTEFGPQENKNIIKVAQTGKPIVYESYNQVSNTCYRIYIYSPKKNNVAAILEDITPLKKAELALRESEMHYRYLFKQNPAPLLIYEIKNLNILFVNEAFLKHYQYTLNEILTKKITDFFPQADVKPIAKLVKKLVGVSYSGEWPNFKKDGTRITVQTHSHGMLFEGHESRIVVINDITKLKEVESALKTSEERLQNLLNSLTDYIYTVSITNGKVIKTTHGEGCIAITGYSSKKLSNDRNLWFNIVHDDDKEAVKQQIESILEKKKSYTLEHRIWHKSGSIRWISNTPVLRYNSDGELIGYDGLIANITDRKVIELTLRESEERYRAIVNLSGHMVFEYSIPENSIIWDGAIEQVTGYSKHDYTNKQYLGWREMIHPEDRIATVTAFQELIRSLKPFHEEYRYINKHNEYIWIEAESFFLAGNNHKTPKVLGVMKDITQRKVLERQILNSVLETEERERLIFSQELHDGIGPLLSAIKMYIQWLGKPDAQVNQVKTLKSIEILIDEASSTLREISFKLSPHILQRFGLLEAINAYTEKLKEISNIVVEINTANIGRFNEKAETIIYRVICECINNTIKHAQATKITINLSFSDQIIYGEYYDNGRGFDMNSLTNKGIGLLNMQSRVKSISGFMEINSTINEGTCIKFHIKMSAD